MAVAPNPIAIAKQRARTAVLSPRDTAGWARMPLALRERAFFSAKVENLRLLQRMQQRLGEAIEMRRREGMGRDGGPGAFQTREKFVAEMQQIAREEGLDPRGRGRPEDFGTLRDITSERRLRLIYDFHLQSAHEHARWLAGQDPDVLAAFPAQQFLRVEPRRVPRVNWPERWSDAGGEFFGGRMIALKTDPVWIALSRFGVPWPPFDFGSGMGLREIRRTEAEKLGLLKPGDPVQPVAKEFNDGLQASVADLSPPLREELKRTFGDQVALEKDTAVWRGNLLADLYDDPRGSVNLGTLPQAVVETVKAATGRDLAGYAVEIGAEAARAAADAGVSRLDFELAPFAVRKADSAFEEGGVLSLTKKLFGKAVSLAIEDAVRERIARITGIAVE